MTYLETLRANQLNNQKRVLKAVEAGMNKVGAARAVGINRRTIWDWSQTDSDFAIQLDLAWLTGRK
ncbi:hypothetical protein N9142_04455, partial [Akkermansiaceae bacterium]|nr:hypothetical protein [Akkermansiaceae bacterium]